MRLWMVFIARFLIWSLWFSWLQCAILVDYYAPLFFLQINKMKPENFCQQFGLCEQVVIISQALSGKNCNLCHKLVTDVESKLKDPDTQVHYVLLYICNIDILIKFTRLCICEMRTPCMISCTLAALVLVHDIMNDVLSKGTVNFFVCLAGLK